MVFLVFDLLLLLLLCLLPRPCSCSCSCCSCCSSSRMLPYYLMNYSHILLQLIVLVLSNRIISTNNTSTSCCCCIVLVVVAVEVVCEVYFYLKQHSRTNKRSKTSSNDTFPLCNTSSQAIGCKLIPCSLESVRTRTQVILYHLGVRFMLGFDVTLKILYLFLMKL